MACSPPSVWRGTVQLLARGPRLRTRCVRYSRVASATQDDAVRRTISLNGELVVTVAVTTKLAAHTAQLHQLAPTANAALNRALIASLLLVAGRTEGERVQLSFKGNGPIGRVVALADHEYRCKGYVGDGSADPPLRSDGKLNVGASNAMGFSPFCAHASHAHSVSLPTGAAVGPLGVLQVTRMHPVVPAYTGTVALASGEIADDVATFLAESDQIASALGLGVSLDRSLSVRAAGGWLVQALPFASDETLACLEANVRALPPISDLVAKGCTPEAITDMILGSIGASDGAVVNQPQYGPCVEADLRARMERATMALGKAELERIVAQEGKLEATCEFCRMTLQLDADSVLRTIASD